MATLGKGSTVSGLQGELLDQVRAGAYPSAEMPAMLADAKAADDKPLIAAILAACNK